jgi:hypothetical protein
VGSRRLEPCCRLWQTSTGYQDQGRVLNFDTLPKLAAFSPDGKLIAVVSRDDSVSIFVANSVLISKSRWPSATSLIARMPLTIKFSITCCSCTRSPSMSGKSSARSVWTKTQFFTAASRFRNNVQYRSTSVQESCMVSVSSSSKFDSISCARFDNSIWSSDEVRDTLIQSSFCSK